MKVSKLYTMRKFGVYGRKRAIQSLLCNLKTEKQIYQYYGIDRNLLQHWRRWYWRQFEQAYISPRSKKIKMPMRTKEKELQARIKELEKQKAELEKSLEWERIKSHTFETMIKIAEKELEIPIRKKPGAKQSEK